MKMAGKEKITKQNQISADSKILEMESDKYKNKEKKMPILDNAAWEKKLFQLHLPLWLLLSLSLNTSADLKTDNMHKIHSICILT